ncbi:MULTISPECIES: nucleotide sugar dehydrogenase [unclassified Spirosoma]|uniref:nucleotide sugar dehydrogenase n=1 Tax=unclassified Spirosoma TaxID=2621999 RepID=UPI0009689E80|nr:MULTISPECIES: nucleotide sugar dehydrogenase [unclassified Spirosoma]MBN8826360.1 nucleotide sugar dehydrogenase [Spirosoma sp.]OJW76123.1 MAG: Vi polysaccharide biosynthesis protein VipA/TviB [Spirosoma sp. 48-14]
MHKATKIGIVGLGYVGLPLAVAFSRKYPVVGYDIDLERIRQLQQGHDVTFAVTREEIVGSEMLVLSSEVTDLSDCTVFIITVPTPIDAFKNPDLRYLLMASAAVGKLLKKGDTVIYESTVYPGCTEDECVPVLERTSQLVYNQDFFCGYSPERISPGDTERTLTKIRKLTSGSTPETAAFVDELYRSIIDAGTYKTPSIKVAEAAKAIENAQRDINISFVNELALIFDRMGIDTHEVLEAARTKWNFLPFRPGLVGGHCIGVDPYYLVHKAQSLGYYPQVIASGRLVNDGMGLFIAKKILKKLISNGVLIHTSRALILGITFKENCPDTRNTKVVDVYRELTDFGVSVDVYDPWASSQTVKQEYGIDLITTIDQTYDAIVLAVAHDQLLMLDIAALKKDRTSVVFDVKSVLDKSVADMRL